jgi:hypothetical protein
MGAFFTTASLMSVHEINSGMFYPLVYVLQILNLACLLII